jgi:hypothetical protein
MRRMSHPGARRLAVLGASVLLTACFEDPIRESLELAFHDDGGFTVTFTAELDAADGWRSRDRALRRRLADHARALEEGWDPRISALERMGCKEHGGAFERRGESLVFFRRWARCGDTEPLGELFGERPVLLELRRDESRGLLELSLLPIGGGPASRAERRQLEERLGEWAELLARYQRAVYALAALADEEPRIARALWRKAFGEDPKAGEEELAAADAAIAGELAEALEAAALSLVGLGDDTESLDEQARRVFDPLSETLAVSTPSPVVELAGFRRDGERRVVSPEGGLLRALGALRGVWLDPDPLADFVEAVRRGTEKSFDPTRYAATSPLRAAAAPSAEELHEELVRALESPAEWRVAWRARPAPEGS